MPKHPKQLPEGLEILPAKVAGNSGAEEPGKIAVKRWTDHERRSRALKRTGKIVGTIFAVAPVGLFIHILILPILTALFFTLVLAAPLYTRLLAEDSTFFYVDASCPYCHESGHLRPYLNTRFKSPVTVQCPKCGQTAHASA